MGVEGRRNNIPVRNNDKTGFGGSRFQALENEDIALNGNDNTINAKVIVITEGLNMRNVHTESTFGINSEKEIINDETHDVIQEVFGEEGKSPNNNVRDMMRWRDVIGEHNKVINQKKMKVVMAGSGGRRHIQEMLE
ncbi:unnamed protein product [Vicia faba]|uniref:Uncharacterized protein n=1 Tax=Vicia faba TaxID=3906 RepID=A0AAV1BDR5_VICFA|nr:unnamed protein product [Vicia faba]